MSKSTRLTMICRGQTALTRVSGFSSHEPLLEGETSKANSLARRLRHFDRLVCAPERSTCDTAAAIGKNATIEPALADLAYGRWNGMTLAEVATQNPAALKTWVDDPQAVPHGGESIAQLFDRLAAWLQENRAAGGHILAVTHPIVIKAAVAAVLEAPTISIWKLDIRLLSTTEFNSDGRRWAMRSMGMADSGDGTDIKDQDRNR